MNTDVVKKYEHFIQGMSGRHSVWQIWNDFISLSAISLANANPLGKSEKREEEYHHIRKTYSEEEMIKFAELFAMLIQDMEESVERDILGEVYMCLRINSKMAGQYFTPYSIADFMAKIAFTEEAELPIMFHEPACGSGVNVIAYANELKRQGINYQQEAYIVAQDLDPLVAKMCYIQMVLMGISGVVVIGDTLKGIYGEKEYWYTPFHFLFGNRILMRLKAKREREQEIVVIEKTEKGLLVSSDSQWMFELIGME